MQHYYADFNKQIDSDYTWMNASIINLKHMDIFTQFKVYKPKDNCILDMNDVFQY